MCSEYGVPPCEQYRRAAAVFIGKVKTIIDGGVPKENRQIADVRFDVEQVFKGNVGPSVDIGYIFNTSCSWSNFETGDRWLVYAYPHQDGKGLQIPFCTGSHKYNEADGDTSFFQNLRERVAQESVMVKIPGGAIDVSVSNQKETFQVTPAGDDVFRANVPGPGEYQVKVTLPFAAEISSFDEFAVKMLQQTESRSSFEYEVAVEKGLCSWRQFDVHKVDLKAAGSITGRLLDAERRPLPGVPVYLAKWDIDEKEMFRDSDMAFPDRDGQFIFGGLREGKYVVLVNPYDFPEKNIPFLKSFLPGVRRYSDAFVLELEQGKEVSVVDFVLPRKLPSRTVELQISWPDGKPVTHENPKWKDDRVPAIKVYKPTGKYLDRAEVTRLSRKGGYSFSVYEGFSYLIGAQAYDAKGGRWNGFVKLKPTKDEKTLKITLAPYIEDANDWFEKYPHPK